MRRPRSRHSGYTDPSAAGARFSGFMHASHHRPGRDKLEQGRRRMVGCYLGMDELHSAARVLRI